MGNTWRSVLATELIKRRRHWFALGVAVVIGMAGSQGATYGQSVVFAARPVAGGGGAGRGCGKPAIARTPQVARLVPWILVG
jgi:hypothetical protein